MNHDLTERTLRPVRDARVLGAAIRGVLGACELVQLQRASGQSKDEFELLLDLGELRGH